MSLTNIESVMTSSSANPVVVNVTLSSIGNLLVVMFNDENGTNTISSITDNGSPSNTWQAVPSCYAGNTNIGTFTDIWYSVCSSPTNQITIHFTNSHNGICQYMEWSGCATTSPVDGGNNFQTGSSTQAMKSPSLSISNGNDLLLACVAVGTSNPTVVTSPWAIVANGFHANFVQLPAPGNTNSQQAVFTASNQNYATSIAAFLPASTQSPALVASMFLTF